MTEKDNNTFSTSFEEKLKDLKDCFKRTLGSTKFFLDPSSVSSSILGNNPSITKKFINFVKPKLKEENDSGDNSNDQNSFNNRSQLYGLSLSLLAVSDCYGTSNTVGDLYLQSAVALKDLSVAWSKLEERLNLDFIQPISVFLATETKDLDSLRKDIAMAKQEIQSKREALAKKAKSLVTTESLGDTEKQINRLKTEVTEAEFKYRNCLNIWDTRVGLLIDGESPDRIRSIQSFISALYDFYSDSEEILTQTVTDLKLIRQDHLLDRVRTGKVGANIYAKYNYNRRANDELSLKKGDKLTLTNQDIGFPGWWEARDSSGTLGIIPSNYVMFETLTAAHDWDPHYDESLTSDDWLQTIPDYVTYKKDDLITIYNRICGKNDWVYGKVENNPSPGFLKLPKPISNNQPDTKPTPIQTMQEFSQNCHEFIINLDMNLICKEKGAQSSKGKESILGELEKLTLSAKTFQNNPNGNLGDLVTSFKSLLDQTQSYCLFKIDSNRDEAIAIAVALCSICKSLSIITESGKKRGTQKQPSITKSIGHFLDVVSSNP